VEALRKISVSFDEDLTAAQSGSCRRSGPARAMRRIIAEAAEQALGGRNCVGSGSPVRANGAAGRLESESRWIR
jgi:hypothetical protein